MRIVPVAWTLAALLAGCSGQPPPPSASLPATAAPAYDGLYRGAVQVTAVAVGSNASWCQTQREVTLNVASDRFSLSLPHQNVPGNPTLSFAVPIAPDGSFQTQSQDGTASFAGRVSGAHLQGTINGAGCQYAVAADRS